MNFEAVADLRRTMGEVTFQSQYQQNPEVIGNNAVRFDEIATCDTPPDRSQCGRVIQSWDPAFTDGPNSDFSVCTTWGHYDGKWYLLHVLRVRMDFVDLQRRIVAMRDQWSADMVVIELDGSGRALVQQLSEMGHRWVVGTKVGNKNKEQRLIAQAARLVSGDYVIPRNEPWFYDLRREFLAFPNGNYDDQVDSISQFIAWLHTPRGRGLLNRNPVTGRRRRVSRRSRPSRR